MVAKSGHDGTFRNWLGRIVRPLMSAIFSLGVISATITPALAQPASCDPAYWNALKAKAWEEAQREIEQNQNLIYMADSVLQYTCFDQFLQDLANAAPNMFSMSTRWGPVLGPNMANALNILVDNSLINYITLNFNNNGALGGRAGIGTYRPQVITAAGAAYHCDQMAQVWEAAKCMNFVDKPDIDDFFMLNKYVGWDPRQYSRTMAACTADGRWPANQNLALNNAQQYKTDTAALVAAFTSTTACSAPAIPTGVTVSQPGTNTTTFAEVICTNPGCAATTGGACSAAP